MSVGEPCHASVRNFGMLFYFPLLFMNKVVVGESVLLLVNKMFLYKLLLLLLLYSLVISEIYLHVYMAQYHGVVLHCGSVVLRCGTTQLSQKRAKHAR
jgi:hypothetical protein